MTIIISAAFCMLFNGLNAQVIKSNGRTTASLNQGWQFTKDSLSVGQYPLKSLVKWQAVSLPHTWNKEDVMDDVPGYYRAACWYRRQLIVDESFKNKEVLLQFLGANQQAEVYVNGKKAGEHIGGYTAFSVPVTTLLRFDGVTNEVLVKVDNSFNENIPPLTADFTFYGGIYRNVNLITTGKVHFKQDDYGANAVYVSTPGVTRKHADVGVKGTVFNSLSSEQSVIVTSTITDSSGKKIAVVNTKLSIKPNEETAFQQRFDSIIKPVLWYIERPYLYTLTTKIIIDKTGEVLDEVVNPLGFRWFRFSADSGFFLNDKHVKLVGASRHQDYKGFGNAVPANLAVKDVEMLKKMGGNFLRVAHYPQHPTVLQACDRLGIIASVEIPVVNTITESNVFSNNCIAMQKEMIRQNYNHPCVVMWAYMNEVLLRPKYAQDKEKQKQYFAAVKVLAQTLEDVTRKEDPSRYTMMANHGDYNRYKEAGLLEIPMIIGWNLYSGWYGGVFKDFTSFLDKHHKELASKPLIISEYGADADPRIRNFNPEKFDKSVEYTNLFHQYYLNDILTKDFVAGATVWNLADFNSETREESMPHINNKGLLTWNRVAKDPYYFYKANLVKQPFVKIASAYWTKRTGIADSAALYCTHPLQVFTNMQEVELVMNGKSLGKQKAVNHACTWQVPFINETNTVEAAARTGNSVVKDKLAINFQLQPQQLKNDKLPFKDINIILGSKRLFISDVTHTTWLPSQSYKPGSWGHIGGIAYKMKNNNRLPYGTDRNITGTADDPIYQTQQTGIESYRFDVAEGTYELTLHFAELVGGNREALAYNLNAANTNENYTDRVFDVIVNGKTILKNFNIVAEYGVAKAVVKKIQVQVAHEGILVEFKAIKGEAVLNAVQLKKLL